MGVLKRLLAGLFVALLIGATPAPGINRNTSALDALGERYWQHELQENFYLRSELGQPIESIPAVTYDNAQADAAFSQDILNGLKAIDEKTLDHDRWLTYRTLDYLASNDVANATYFWLQQQATPYAGGSQIAAIQSIFQTFALANTADAQRYTTLLGQYAGYVRSLGDLLHEQHARGIILPNVESDASQAVFAGYALPAQSEALVPDIGRLSALAPQDREPLREAASRVVAAEIVPAFTNVARYLGGPYREGAPSGVGLGQYPGGSAYYRHLVVAYTTLSITPDNLHAMGIAAVASLNATLAGIQREVGYRGTLAQFKHFLATDKQFFLKTPEQFGDRLSMFAARSYAAAPKYFRKLPKTPFGVQALPKALAGAQTFGYYDQATAARKKGLYLYNAWHPERTSALGAGALICHELIPGHHFQISLQQENTALPNVRHYDFSETGFVEGWGEYSSQLCWDMGVYRSPYDRAGRVMQDLMVSTRLVVDTGMNAMGWSRERAMAFMRENLTLSEAQIESESLRYSTDIPGQALAYKTGELTMLALRKHVQEKMGQNFDIRAFHAWVIDSGAMTLDTLRAHVDYELAHSSLR